MTLLLPRAMLIIIGAAITGFLLHIWLLCHNRDRPITGIRKLLCKVTAKLGLSICIIFGWFVWFRCEYLTEEQVGNYEEYLGPVGE